MDMSWHIFNLMKLGHSTVGFVLSVVYGTLVISDAASGFKADRKRIIWAMQIPNSVKWLKEVWDMS